MTRPGRTVIGPWVGGVSGSALRAYEGGVVNGGDRMDVERLEHPPWFDTDWYLAEYPDIAQAEVSPLLHFIAHGEQEGRLPCGLEAQCWDLALWRRPSGKGVLPSLHGPDLLTVEAFGRSGQLARAWQAAAMCIR